VNWNFVHTGAHPGEYNMSFDEELARELLTGVGLPTVRLYEWKPWAVSLGHHQDIAEIDDEKTTITRSKAVNP